MFTKKFHGRREGNFHGRKLTRKMPPRKIAPRKFAPHPQKEKIGSRKYYLLGKMSKKERMITKLIKTKSLHSPTKNAS